MHIHSLLSGYVPGSETQIEIIFVGEIEQKHSIILCLKRKCVNIKFFFVELLYEINITFVIMLLFGGKKVNDINIYISDHILNFVIILNLNAF